MIRYFLKLDYSVSQWMGKNNHETAINGTVHLFLTKMGFVFQSVYALVLYLLPINLGTEIAVVGVMVITGIIMYGFPKLIKKSIKTYKIPQEYKRTDLKQRKTRNGLALFYLITSFSLMFLAIIFFFESYGVR